MLEEDGQEEEEELVGLGMGRRRNGQEKDG